MKSGSTSIFPHQWVSDAFSSATYLWQLKSTDAFIGVSHVHCSGFVTIRQPDRISGHSQLWQLQPDKSAPPPLIEHSLCEIAQLSWFLNCQMAFWFQKYALFDEITVLSGKTLQHDFVETKWTEVSAMCFMLFSPRQNIIQSPSAESCGAMPLQDLSTSMTQERKVNLTWRPETCTLSGNRNTSTEDEPYSL